MRTRRGRGEGSVYQRKDGLWAAAMTVGYTETGKRRVRTIYAKSKREVIEKLTQLRQDASNGALPDVSSVTVADFMKQWLEAASQSLRATSHARYTALNKNQVTPSIGGLKLAKLQPLHVQAMLNGLKAKGESATTLRMSYALLHKACSVAVKWRMLTVNPCDAVETPAVPKVQAEALSPEQAFALLTASKTFQDGRWHALYALALGTGLRQGELFALNWEDVRLSEGYLSCGHSMQNLGKVARVETKTKKGRRVDLDAVSIGALKAHRARMLAEGNAPHATALVFCDTDGGPLRKSNFIRRVHAPLLKAAGLPYMKFHGATRHTSATMMLSMGVHPKVVQERLGHSTIAMTLDTYSHMLPTMQQDSVRALDALWERHAAKEEKVV